MSYPPDPDKPESNRFEDKKIDHESTKIRRHESLNVVLFRVFNLSCFRDYVSQFSARKNTKIIASVNFGMPCTAYRWVLFRSADTRLVSGG